MGAPFLIEATAKETKKLVNPAAHVDLWAALRAAHKLHNRWDNAARYPQDSQTGDDYFLEGNVKNRAEQRFTFQL